MPVIGPSGRKISVCEKCRGELPWVPGSVFGPSRALKRTGRTFCAPEKFFTDKLIFRAYRTGRVDERASAVTGSNEERS